jgi:hypothetical protein
MALSDRDRRTLTIGGAVAGVLLLGFLLLNLLGGGGGEETALPTGPVPTGTVTVTESPSATATPSVVLSFGGRNPFSIPPGLASASATSTSTSSSSGSPSSTVTSTITSTPSAPSGGSSHTTQDGKTVVLIDTFKRNGVEKAQISVDSTTYTVEEGETFAGTFEVRSINGDCATIDHGDESFTLCANPQK